MRLLTRSSLSRRRASMWALNDVMRYPLSARMTVRMAAFCNTVGTDNRSIGSTHLGGEYTRALGGRSVTADRCERGFRFVYLVCRTGTSLAFSGTRVISKIFGQ